MLGFDRITFDPKIMAGQACIRGMRVPVSLVLNLLANGQTPEAIIEDYPYLEPEDIQQSLQYAKKILGIAFQHRFENLLQDVLAQLYTREYG
jgi:uncharacterized protein (DUF433 family)